MTDTALDNALAELQRLQNERAIVDQRIAELSTERSSIDGRIARVSSFIQAWHEFAGEALATNCGTTV